MKSDKQILFQAISDPTRREVMMLLSKQSLTIAEIAAKFPVSRTAITKHLQVLSDAELVQSERIGREKIYRLHAEPLQNISDWFHYFEQFWDNKLQLLKYTIENKGGLG